MPLIWRAMRMANGQPEVGRAGNLLGVRVGASEADDIPEENGFVQSDTGGMSVSPSLETLPPHRLPRRLRSRFPEANGSNQLYCWSMGEGAFVSGVVAEHLVLRIDPEEPERHGFVEPERKMPAAEYEAAIAATRDHWKRWEE
ncbi:MAG: hypothetical protein ACRELG_21390 [Gemmataceae bacterium]